MATETIGHGTGTATGTGASDTCSTGSGSGSGHGHGHGHGDGDSQRVLIDASHFSGKQDTKSIELGGSTRESHSARSCCRAKLTALSSLNKKTKLVASVYIVVSLLILLFYALNIAEFNPSDLALSSEIASVFDSVQQLFTSSSNDSTNSTDDWMRLEATAYPYPYQASHSVGHEKLCKQWKCRNLDGKPPANADSVTVVTAYFNLGTFPKGGGTFTTSLYWNWILVYSKVANSLLFYSDDQSFGDRLLDLRSSASANMRTCVCILERHSLWSFRLIPRIKEVILRPGQPKHAPNTVVPEYGAAMHAKYELLGIASSENVFGTRYFAWSDVGVFRWLAGQIDKVRPFELALPPSFNVHRVAYTQVFQPDFNGKVQDIFWNNMVWVCGCFFVAERSVMLQWTKEYLRFADLLLRNGLSSTDQQVLYAMFNRQFAFSTGRPLVRVQEYVPTDGDPVNVWFFLAYLCRHEGLKLQTQPRPAIELSATVPPETNPFEIVRDITKAREAVGKDPP